MSSSASIEVAVAFALRDLIGEVIEFAELALLCQHAQNKFVGARCGIMDQFIASHGKHRLLPIPDHARLVICNTMIKHNHANGKYNQRRAECEAGVRYLSKHLGGIPVLRDVTPDDFAAFGQDHARS